MSLAEFLARIAEDEADATQLDKELGRWQRERTVNGPDGSQGSIIASLMDGAFDPARVLAECEAKRRIVERYLAEDAASEAPGDYYHQTAAGYCATGLLEAIRLLASVHADRPDFREEWRP